MKLEIRVGSYVLFSLTEKYVRTHTAIPYSVNMRGAYKEMSIFEYFQVDIHKIFKTKLFLYDDFCDKFISKNHPLKKL